ncbi:MAG: hypothetical protein N2482_03040 [Patescibacteria group bacterium]|nr:hypothetical protein [Patescibacteria group bacterium]
MQTLLLIDGNGIMHRAYHALPLLTSNDGTPTNVIYGFFSMFYKVIHDFKPDYLSVVFDTPAPTFRKKIFEKYQVQRPKIEDNFALQIPLVKEGLDKAGIFRLEKDGYEADDIIGTLVDLFQKNNFRVVIVSGDKDIFQLIKENVFVATPVLGISQIKIYDSEEVIKKLGVRPEQIVDYKALVGDPSDNYPGAKGIGPKTAIKLLTKFNNLEGIYQNLEKIDSEKIKQILSKEKENIFLSKKLAKIICNVLMEIDINKMKFKTLPFSFKDFLEKYQMYSLIKRFFSEKKTKETKIEKKNENQMKLFKL